MISIFERFGVKPTSTGSSMMVAGTYPIETTLDVSEAQQVDVLIQELQAQGLQVSRDQSDQNVLKVSGEAKVSFSRGNDREGRKALWISCDGVIVDLILASLAYIYQSNGWQLSSGRFLREVIAKIGGELTLPDGTIVFVGSTADYSSSLLATDGSCVHPRLTNEQKQLLGINDAINDGDNIDEDPFK